MRQEVVQKFGLYRIVTTYLVSDWIQVQCANLWTSILMFGGLGMHGKGSRLAVIITISGCKE